jgi:hypothetical protein
MEASMKRIIVATILTASLLLALAQHTLAQQSAEASINETLQLLGDKLERYGEVRISYGIHSTGRQTFQRFEYLGSEGCLFRYRLRHQEISSTIGFGKSSASFGNSEWSVNLAQVDPERIEIKMQKDWTGGFVNFHIVDDARGVKCHDCAGPNPNKYSTGGFAIGDKNALDAIATALKQAVCLCRK